MNRPLPEVITDILTYNGAVVEKVFEKDAGKSLEVITPSEISAKLNIPEYSILRFSYKDTSVETVYASYDSDFFNSINILFTGRGRLAASSIEPYMPNTDKIAKTIKDKITFANATFRLEKTDTSSISYILVFFKYVAISDEKHEGILPVLINELNSSTVSCIPDIDGIVERLQDPPPLNPLPQGEGRLEGQSRGEDAKIIPPPLTGGGQGEGGLRGFSMKDKVWLNILQSTHASALQAIEVNMKDFIKSLERRLNRDIKRVYEYYEALKAEAKNLIEKKAASGGDAIEKLLKKIEVIESEREWKIQDLIAKYALTIKAEPVAAIRIATKTPVFWIDIKRRLASRRFPVTYNPIIKHLDALPCESCFYPRNGYYICDDKQHIICGNCFKGCSSCGKQYCKACFKNGCPRH
ncbi:MAG: hypothetical protein PH343_05290 [Nitrospira sp.]|nr:hypothetical protein [Nitrospira sp.]